MTGTTGVCHHSDSTLNFNKHNLYLILLFFVWTPLVYIYMYAFYLNCPKHIRKWNVNVFSYTIIAASMSWIDSEHFHFMVILSLGKSDRSHSARSDEYSACRCSGTVLGACLCVGQHLAAALTTVLIIPPKDTQEGGLQNCFRKWQQRRDTCARSKQEHSEGD